MSKYPDEFDGLHKALVEGAMQHPSYPEGSEALSGYSEGAEHALDTIRLRGYRKPQVLGYAVVDRAGAAIHTYMNHEIAQQVAEESTSNCKDAGIDWDYRVAEIVEAAA